MTLTTRQGPGRRRAPSLDDVTLTPKQALALQIHAKFGTTKKVAEILGIASSNASRILILTRARAKVVRLGALAELADVEKVSARVHRI